MIAQAMKSTLANFFSSGKKSCLKAVLLGKMGKNPGISFRVFCKSSDDLGLSEALVVGL